MSNLIEHAKREMGVVDEPDEFQRDVLELIAAFAKQGHSGGSAPIAIGTFARLAHFKPLGPLQGTEDEWVDVGPFDQNKRRSSVFREHGKNETAYDLDGYVLEAPDGFHFTSEASRAPVTFPYSPPEKPPVLKVPAELYEKENYAVAFVETVVRGVTVARTPIIVTAKLAGKVFRAEPVNLVIVEE